MKNTGVLCSSSRMSNARVGGVSDVNDGRTGDRRVGEDCPGTCP